MTDDDVIQFAAEKIGVEINRLATWGISFEGENVWATWDLGKGESLTPFALDSWELFGRGLGAFKEENHIKKCITCDIDSLGLVLLYKWFDDAEAKDWCIQEKFEDVADLPKAFWRCWYRLEHDET